MIDQYKCAKEFAEYISENHYVLVNVQNKIYYWKDETSLRTTAQLLACFISSKQK